VRLLLAEAQLRLVVHAMVVVCPVHLDQPEHPANLDDQENPVPPVYLETLENLQFNHVNQSLHHHANLAHKDHLDHPDLLDRPAMLVLLVNPVTPARMLHPESPDQKAHLDHPASLDNQELPENLVPQLNPNPSCPANLDPLEKPAHPVLPDPLVNLAPMEPPDPLDRKALPAKTDHPVKTDNPEPQVNLDQPDRPARRVSARNIVPSMVVCSSKTVPDDRLFSFLCLQPFIQVSSTTAFAGVVVFSFSSYFSYFVSLSLHLFRSNFIATKYRHPFSYFIVDNSNFFFLLLRTTSICI